MATGGRVVKIMFFFVNTCQALLAEQLEISGMATGFGKLSTQKKTPPKI